MTPAAVASERKHMETLLREWTDHAREVKQAALRVQDDDGELEALVNQLERRRARLHRHLEAIDDLPMNTLVVRWEDLRADAEHLGQDLQVAISEVERTTFLPALDIQRYR